MNVRLQYATAFNAGSWFDEELIMSTYQLRVRLVTESMDPVDQNIALERIKHFLLGELHSTIFVNQAEMEQAEAFAELGLDVTTLPEEPVDQVVGIMLFHKLNAIMEGRMRITELVMSSDAGDNIEYFHSEAEHTDLFPAIGWWNSPTLKHNDIEYTDNETSGNVVAIDSADEWRELELAWNNTEVTTDLGQVVFANFNQNETKH
jgi:hypothetical protein